MNCPYCKHDDLTEPFRKITARVVEWICWRCGLTWNVEDE